jgi:UDP-N-acetylmuramoyl-L-alanyl-D-glutamate--2,6-diaminopimelate ligase
MILSKLLEKVTVRKMFQTLYGRMVVTHEVDVRSVAVDSRAVGRGDLFVAVRGSAADGHRFVHDAISAGAKVVVVEDDSSVDDAYCMHTGTVKVVVPDSRTALAAISAEYYGRPADRLTMVGVTGTNGKTTTASLIHSLLTRTGGGSPVGLIGTIDIRIGDRVRGATHTTPGPPELHAILSEMVNSGCSSAVMEVSSHALDQRRVEGLRFRTAVFTNLTRDHLDYHADMEAYFEAKSMLFTSLEGEAGAVINVDDGWGTQLAARSGGRILTYAIGNEADLRALKVEPSDGGMTFTMTYMGKSAEIRTALPGRFNVSNLLATAGAGLSMGLPFEEIAGRLGDFGPARGRFEPVRSAAGWTVIIDYAHTPDALEKTITAARECLPRAGNGRIITVFGCGGNRDRKKRPLMGKLAASLSDVTIVTSDNPRDEDPEKIIDEILAGTDTPKEIFRESDRAKAIRMALEMAEKGDIVLVAGKGHEEYQVIGAERVPFSDRKIAEEFIGAVP